MRNLLILIGLIGTIAFANCDDFSSAEYFKLSAKEKSDKLWEKISENEEPFSFYSNFQVAKIFFEDVSVTFKEMGDLMPSGRKKLIHTVGNIAKAEFVAEKDTIYTGIFKGSKNMYLRYSLAKKSDPSKTSAYEAYGNFVPGISMKFLVDGQPSSNLMAMYTTHGQPSWNPFWNDFTNSFRIPDDSAMAEKALAAKFSSATSWVSSLGVKDMAIYDEAGNYYENPIYPYKVIFRPTDAVKNLFPDDYTEDFKEQLKTIPAGTVIYDVYAIDEPGCDEQKIGFIRINTKLNTSRWADESMFFRHGLIDNDDKGDHADFVKFRDSYSFWSWSGTHHGQEPSKKFGCPFANLFQ